MKATNVDGSLRVIEECYLTIPGFRKFQINNLPDITDSKSANYAEESIMGRSSPFHSYISSSTRQVGINFHLFITKEGDAQKNLEIARAIQSCCYPRFASSSSAPYLPPPICRFKCGDLVATKEVCLILQNYSLNWPTDVVWDEATFCPYKFDINTSWWVVYSSANLPWQNDIIETGYS